MGRLLTFPAPVSERRDDAAPTGFYRPAEAARIARVPRHRLAAWQREGIIVPRLEIQLMDDPLERGYTFAELVYLRLIRMLRDKSIPLVSAVKAVKHLEDRYGPPGPAWANVRIFAQGRDVYVDSADEWEVTVATKGGQKLASVLFGTEFERLRERADALLIPTEFQPFVEIDPAVRSGLPIVLGTTIETGLVYQLRQDQLPYQRIHDYYPVLTIPQIKAAIRYEGFLDAEAA